MALQQRNSSSIYRVLTLGYADVPKDIVRMFYHFERETLKTVTYDYILDFVST